MGWLQVTAEEKRISTFVLGCIALLIPAAALARGDTDPLDVAKRFVRMDGEGKRLRRSTWRAVAPLVSWEVEPAWDRVELIDGAQLGNIRTGTDHAEVEVTYVVASEVNAGKQSAADRVTQITLSLQREDSTGAWRVLGPPQLPRVYRSHVVDTDDFVRSFEPDAENYTTSSSFLWRALRKSRSSQPYLLIKELATVDGFDTVETPEPGDVVLYLDGEVAYHGGIVTAGGTVLSATMNAGVIDLPLDAFAGVMRFRRPSSARPTAKVVPTRGIPEAPEP